MMLVGHAESQSPCGLFLTAWHLPTCCCLAGCMASASTWGPCLCAVAVLRTGSR